MAQGGDGDVVAAGERKHAGDFFDAGVLGHGFSCFGAQSVRCTGDELGVVCGDAFDDLLGQAFRQVGHVHVRLDVGGAQLVDLDALLQDGRDLSDFWLEFWSFCGFFGHGLFLSRKGNGTPQ